MCNTIDPCKLMRITTPQQAADHGFDRLQRMSIVARTLAAQGWSPDGDNIKRGVLSVSHAMVADLCSHLCPHIALALILGCDDQPSIEQLAADVRLSQS